jgi:hypothetical protein
LLARRPRGLPLRYKASRVAEAESSITAVENREVDIKEVSQSPATTTFVVAGDCDTSLMSTSLFSTAVIDDSASATRLALGGAEKACRPQHAAVGRGRRYRTDEYGCCRECRGFEQVTSPHRDPATSSVPVLCPLPAEPRAVAVADGTEGGAEKACRPQHAAVGRGRRYRTDEYGCCRECSSCSFVVAGDCDTSLMSTSLFSTAVIDDSASATRHRRGSPRGRRASNSACPRSNRLPAKICQASTGRNRLAILPQFQVRTDRRSSDNFRTPAPSSLRVIVTPP